MNTLYNIQKIFFGALFIFSVSSCRKFVEIDPPRTDLIKETVFQSDVTAEAAILDIYYRMRTGGGFASGGFQSISFLTTLSSDEQINYISTTPQMATEFNSFNHNSIAPNNSVILSIWSEIYNCIYKANSVIEGVASSTGMSEKMKKQLEGEAKFIRAFCHFYLVNLWGDVPLITTTDYRTNSTIPRAPVAQVYEQIVNDLTDAQTLLIDDYSFSNNQRVRANKGVVNALLARAYLYKGDWVNAEKESTAVISNANYQLVSDLSKVTEKNNSEAILQLWSDAKVFPEEIFTFYIFSQPLRGAIRPEFVNEFEPNDQRNLKWIGIVNGYIYSKKHSSFVAGAEYSTLLRLAELYLIRAEARTQLNNIAGAQEDINILRHRAGLDNTPASDKQSLLQAVERERKHELFNEWGHRWLDLKRTGRADALLGSIKPQWKSTAVLFPIPEVQIINNPAITQNAGY